MTYIFNENQFKPGKIKGTLVTGINFASLTCQIYDSSTETFYGGTPVRIINTTKGDYVIEKAKTTNAILGVVIFDRKKNNSVAGDFVDVALSGNIMFMEAGAAINAGALVEAVATGDKVITSAGTNTVLGRALVAAAASGDMIPVLIDPTLVK
jgi:hypothetical protein